MLVFVHTVEKNKMDLNRMHEIYCGWSAVGTLFTLNLNFSLRRDLQIFHHFHQIIRSHLQGYDG